MPLITPPKNEEAILPVLIAKTTKAKPLANSNPPKPNKDLTVINALDRQLHRLINQFERIDTLGAQQLIVEQMTMTTMVLKEIGLK